MRLAKRGYNKSVSKGYKADKEVRSLHISGLKQIIVKNVFDLNNLNAQTEGALIASTVGVKKKLEIIKKAIELKITILNVKDPQEYIKKKEDDIKKVKETKAKKKQEREEKKKATEKKAKEKKEKEKTDELADKVSDEEKKKQEKDEKDKILTKKQ